MGKVHGQRSFVARVCAEGIVVERLRSDRRKLIEFIISSNVIKAVDFPTGTSGVEDVDLDAISADYMLECAVNGKVLDISEAARMRYNEMNLPIMLSKSTSQLTLLLLQPLAKIVFYKWQLGADN
ncbi:hypothetical protein EJ110_NYTH20046 [Nymphaea thermarum]|nr:hypothetical protein EJ110_NYTH20046 [Nymphaea thermarum]